MNESAEPKPDTEPTWIKIGDLVVPIARIIKFKRWSNGVVVYIDGDARIDVFSFEAGDLWASLTNPARCVDLTPAVATTTANP